MKQNDDVVIKKTIKAKNSWSEVFLKIGHQQFKKNPRIHVCWC